MRTYSQFHGEIPVHYIGKELRVIAAKKQAFKIITGYGSNTGQSLSKNAALKSLRRMRREGVIKDYIPGEMVTELIINSADYYLTVRYKYWAELSKDRDKGNDGVIFVFC